MFSCKGNTENTILDPNTHCTRRSNTSGSPPHLPTRRPRIRGTGRRSFARGLLWVWMLVVLMAPRAGQAGPCRG